MTPQLAGRCHHLKCHPEALGEVAAGRKRFEFRKNDRNYQVGDSLVLYDWSQCLCGCPSSELPPLRVTYILHGPDYGVPEGFCVMSLEWER